MKESIGQASPTDAPNPNLPGDSLIVVRQVTAADMLAYSIATAAVVIDLSYATIYREIRRGKIRQTHFGLITRVELLRYLATGETAKPRIKRRNRNVGVPLGDSLQK